MPSSLPTESVVTYPEQIAGYDTFDIDFEVLCGDLSDGQLSYEAKSRLEAALLNYFNGVVDCREDIDEIFESMTVVQFVEAMLCEEDEEGDGGEERRKRQLLRADVSSRASVPRGPVISVRAESSAAVSDSGPAAAESASGFIDLSSAAPFASVNIIEERNLQRSSFQKLSRPLRQRRRRSRARVNATYKCFKCRRRRKGSSRPAEDAELNLDRMLLLLRGSLVDRSLLVAKPSQTSRPTADVNADASEWLDGRSNYGERRLDQDDHHQSPQLATRPAADVVGPVDALEWLDSGKSNYGERHLEEDDDREDECRADLVTSLRTQNFTDVANVTLSPSYERNCTVGSSDCSSADGEYGCCGEMGCACASGFVSDSLCSSAACDIPEMYSVDVAGEDGNNDGSSDNGRNLCCDLDPTGTERMYAEHCLAACGPPPECATQPYACPNYNSSKITFQINNRLSVWGFCPANGPNSTLTSDDVELIEKYLLENANAESMKGGCSLDVMYERVEVVGYEPVPEGSDCKSLTGEHSVVVINAFGPCSGEYCACAFPEIN